MDRCIYHLDGRQALRFLDILLEIPEIHAIQWVPGAGYDYWADWIEVYRRIQGKGKALQILSIPANDLPHLFEALRPEGVWISHVSGITNRDEAQAAVALATILRAGATPPTALVNGTTTDPSNTSVSEPAVLLVPYWVNSANMATTVIKDNFVSKSDLCNAVTAAVCAAAGIQ